MVLPVPGSPAITETEPRGNPPPRISSKAALPLLTRSASLLLPFIRVSTPRRTRRHSPESAAPVRAARRRPIPSTESGARPAPSRRHEAPARRPGRRRVASSRVPHTVLRVTLTIGRAGPRPPDAASIGRARTREAPGPFGAGPSGLWWEPARAGSRSSEVLRQELGRTRERDGARAGQIARVVDRLVEGRPDAEDAHQRRGVAQPVGQVAGRRAGLGDRVGSAGRERPGVLLLAVGPRPVAVGARGGGGARLGHPNERTAGAGADARAAIERCQARGAQTVLRAPGYRRRGVRVALEAVRVGAGAGLAVTAKAAEHAGHHAEELSRLGLR